MTAGDQWITYEDVDSAALKVNRSLFESARSVRLYRHSMQKLKDLVAYLFGVLTMMVCCPLIYFRLKCQN